MKVKKCPARKNCFDYKDNNCDNCNFGNEFTKLHKRIDRLKKQNETLTIQRNAWALTAKALGNKWISVEERLPEITETVLIAYKEKWEWETEWTFDVDVGSLDITGREWDTYHDLYEGQELHITHWMPLPEPPIEKGERQ